MRHVSTYISLPPGVPSGAVIREFLHLVFSKYRWFAPARYGMAFLDGKLSPERIDFDALLDFYEKRQTLCVAAKTDRDFLWLFPAKSDSPPYVGTILWATSEKSTSKPSWRASHLEQVTEVMRLVRSPLAVAALDDDRERKTRRWVPEGIGLTKVFTVRDYGEGLAGLYWRNFFGPPFLRLFGERLDSLPAECRQSLGEDLVLVQPYETTCRIPSTEGGNPGLPWRVPGRPPPACGEPVG
jgi:hypothetical protein